MVMLCYGHWRSVEDIQLPVLWIDAGRIRFMLYRKVPDIKKLPRVHLSAHRIVCSNTEEMVDVSDSVVGTCPCSSRR